VQYVSLSNIHFFLDKFTTNDSKILKFQSLYRSALQWNGKQAFDPFKRKPSDKHKDSSREYSSRHGYTSSDLSSSSSYSSGSSSCSSYSHPKSQPHSSSETSSYFGKDIKIVDPKNIPPHFVGNFVGSLIHIRLNSSEPWLETTVPQLNFFTFFFSMNIHTSIIPELKSIKIQKGNKKNNL
jgi:hypothetical protein